MYHGCLGTCPDEPCTFFNTSPSADIGAGRQIKSQTVLVSKVNGILEEFGLVRPVGCNSEIVCIGHEAAEIRHHIR